MSQQHEEWITVKQAAEIMGVDPATVSRLCREQIILCKRHGEKMWDVDKASAEAYEINEGGRGKKNPKPNQ